METIELLNKHFTRLIKVDLLEKGIFPQLWKTTRTSRIQQWGKKSRKTDPYDEFEGPGIIQDY